MRRIWGKSLRKLLIALLLFGACFWWSRIGREVFFSAHCNQPDFILDAGHGGEDGGAVSLTGGKESDINLAIVLRLDQMLGLFGNSPLMLRSEDISLHNEEAVTLREKKVSDLKNRVKIASEIGDATLISIHQNTYQETKYKGAQVFYAPTGGSKELAQEIQNALKQYLQPDNTRQEKQIPEGVYLMNHIENRAVLVECGFLSNPQEEQLLRQDAYQRKMALVLSAVLLEAVDLK